MAVLWFTWFMSAVPRFLLIAAIVFGTGTYVTDTWIRGDGTIEAPSGFAGTCLGIGLILAAIGLRIVMRDEARARRG